MNRREKTAGYTFVEAYDWARIVPRVEALLA